MQRYAFGPVSTPTVPQATKAESTSATIITPGSTIIRSNATEPLPTAISGHIFCHSYDQKILQSIPITMTLAETDEDETTKETMDTQVIDNRSPA